MSDSDDQLIDEFEQQFLEMNDNDVSLLFSVVFIVYNYVTFFWIIFKLMSITLQVLDECEQQFLEVEDENVSYLLFILRQF